MAPVANRFTIRMMKQIRSKTLISQLKIAVHPVDNGSGVFPIHAAVDFGTVASGNNCNFLDGVYGS